MDTKDKTSEQKKQSTSEQAINHKETDGKKINHQVEKRKEKHQPRDNA
ncbi:hypothetical protein HX109_00635 [Galbibacter sp. BG1]|nr:hypothetical protein [Galbibacter sp. BG1]QLE00136.1 hypothetical protein HX109_00635 [Galbibacter sp. BG1]